ncbi:TetR family transcriptional regulator [Natranaerovirga hydrolytica]|uniref:TetR family transcriptional regulator n=1 Tax=Natranaerovirga hydrolytica TaxID=680378 RepID=A0A4V2PZB1_9FIRM|nr:TetR/AcrR family transcriptional regulator [Natranaerovirga hydrolytica]TCK89151.1 TetR family transcriptional regulator [Natranaerovirga hydrolytica]
MSPKENIPLKRRRGIETQEKIFETAANLFARDGYDNVPIRKIASVIGIKESSIYNHFDSKSSILDNLFEYFSKELLKSRPTDEELESMMAYLSAEEILKNIIIRMGHQNEKVLDHIASIIFVERFRNTQAAKLYFKLIIEEQSEFYSKVFRLMKEKGLAVLPEDDINKLAVQYNYVLVALANEYAMAKNGLAEPLDIVKKMMDTASFFVQKLTKG